VKALCVVAHQDDEMGCLGTLIKYRRAAHEVGLVCVTNGDKGMSFDPTINHAEAALIREREMNEVARELDASYTCLGHSDEFLFDGPDLRIQLVEVLRTQQADVVFTHFERDYNRDHEVTSQALRQAALLAHIASVRQDVTPLDRPPAIFYMDPGQGYGFEGTHFIELSEEIMHDKARLVRLHRSQMDVIHQLQGRDYADKLLEDAKRNGERALVAYAEVFRPCLAHRRIPTTTMLP
jgi:N-acetylglucosamine malate deacetylase 1